MSFLIVAVLLALPVYAVQRLGPGFYWLGIYFLVLSAITYWRYAVINPNPSPPRTPENSPAIHRWGCWLSPIRDER